MCIEVAEAADRQTVLAALVAQLHHAGIGVAVRAWVEIRQILVGRGDEQMTARSQHAAALRDEALQVGKVINRLEDDEHVFGRIRIGHL